MCFHVFPCFSHHLFALSQASVMLTKMLALGKAWRSRRRAAGQSQRTPTVSLQLLEFLWFKKNFSSCDMFSTCSVIVQVWKPSSLNMFQTAKNLGHFRGLPWCSILPSYPALHPLHPASPTWMSAPQIDVAGSCHGWVKIGPPQNWTVNTINGLVGGKIYRKPWFLPSNIGVSCKFSHHPILWY